MDGRDIGGGGNKWMGETEGEGVTNGWERQRGRG